MTRHVWKPNAVELAELRKRIHPDDRPWLEFFHGPDPTEHDDRAVREKIEADREADFYREEEASPVDYEEEEEG